MDLRFIHANEKREELRVVDAILSGDIEINISPKAELIDNTWSMTIDEKTWEEAPILEGHYMYIPQTEWGGVVTLLKHSTVDRTLTMQGPTFRGLLYQKRIIPPEGEGYFELTAVDANEAIRLALGDRFGSLIVVTAEDYGKNVSAAWRYQTIAAGVQDVLRANGLRLQVVYDNVRTSAVLSAQKVTDLASVIDISQDYGVDFSSQSGNVQLANHCLALGQGELAAREVANIYRVGSSYYLNKPEQLDEKDVRTVLLDYSNAESTEELIRSAMERLREMAPERSVSIDELSADIASAELGDLIGVRDRLTGMTSESEITRKIMTIQNGDIVIDAKVG